MENSKSNGIKQKIKKELKRLADKKYKEFISNLCPGINNILGIRVPVLRNYAKELTKKYEFEYLMKNIDNEYYEEIMLQGMIIGLQKNISFEEVIKYIKIYIPKIDNWAINDVFCAGLKIVKKNRIKMWNFIQEYLKSDKEFELRFAIVIILDYYIDEEYIQKVFKIYNNIKNEKYYVQMAIAWGISICLIKFYKETVKFLESDKCELDKFTFNKSIKKAIESYRTSNEQKEYLRKMKK